MRSSARVNCASRFFTVFKSAVARSTRVARDCSRPRTWASCASREASISRASFRPCCARRRTPSRRDRRSSPPRCARRGFPGLGEKLLGGRGACLQGAHLHIERAVAAAVALVGLVDRGNELVALGLDLRDRAFDLHDARLGDGQGVVGVGEALGDAGKLGIGLVEQDLQRALVVLEQHDLVARGREIGFQKADPLVRHGALVAQRLIVLAEGADLGRLPFQMPLELDDLGALARELVGQLGARALEIAHRLARKVQLVAQPLILALERRGFLLDLAIFDLERLIGRPHLAEIAPQGNVLGLLDLERPQSLVRGLHDLDEGILEFIELVDLAASVDEEVAQGLVFLAEAHPHIGETVGFEAVEATVRNGGERSHAGKRFASRFRLSASKKLGELTHDP